LCGRQISGHHPTGSRRGMQEVSEDGEASSSKHTSSTRRPPSLRPRILRLGPHLMVFPYPHQHSPKARPRSYGAGRHWTCAVSRWHRRWALMYGVGRRHPAASPYPAHNTLLPPLLLYGDLDYRLNPADHPGKW